MAFQIQVRGNWAGTSGEWRPAIEATFATRGEAQVVHEEVVLPTYRAEMEQTGIDWAAGDEDVRDNAPAFRIIEVST